MDQGDVEQALFGMSLEQLRRRIGPDHRLICAYEMVEHGYADSLKLAVVGRSSGIEHNHLNRLLRRSVGLTLHCLLIRRRLLEATRRLATTDESLTAIAGDCGFGTLRTLERNCVSLLGETPAMLRRASALHEPAWNVSAGQDLRG